MSRLRLKQLAQDGATTGQALVWTGTSWVATTLAASVQWWDDVLTSQSGGETSILLGQNPLSRSERLWKRSAGVEVLLDRGSDYTISGSRVTLTAAMTTGQQIRTYYAYAAGLAGAAGSFEGLYTSTYQGSY